MDSTLERVDEIEAQLLSRAFLYDDQAAYRAGVAASMAALRELLGTTQAVA